jgi:hypothetical protein
LTALRYVIDLQADDYVAMNLGAQRHKGRNFFLTVGTPLGVIVLFGLRALTALSWPTASLFAVTAAVGAYVVFAVKRTGLPERLRGRYKIFPYDRLLGEQVIEFTDDGIRTRGLFFESFRKWPVITTADFTPSYVFVHTIYGLIYTLPRRFVPNSDELRDLLARHIPISVFKDQGIVAQSRLQAASLPPRHTDQPPNVVSTTACSFCLRPQKDVFWLVAGAQAVICDECTRAAESVIAEAHISRATPPYRWWLRLLHFRR